jgi:hypothetical protein
MANPAFVFVNPIVTLGSTPNDVTCELSKAELTPAITMKDAGSLCGPAELPGDIKWTFDLEGFQAYDSTTPDLARFLFDNRRQTVPFSMVCKDAPVGADNPKISGECVCVPGQFGGTQSEIAVFQASLPLVGEPVFDDVGPLEAETASASASTSSTSSTTE